MVIHGGTLICVSITMSRQKRWPIAGLGGGGGGEGGKVNLYLNTGDRCPQIISGAGKRIGKYKRNYTFNIPTLAG